MSEEDIDKEPVDIYYDKLRELNRQGMTKSELKPFIIFDILIIVIAVLCYL